MTNMNPATPTKTRSRTHALLSDVTSNRGTVVALGSEDDCRAAATDDREVVMTIFGDAEPPDIGQRVHHWHDGTGEVCS